MKKSSAAAGERVRKAAVLRAAAKRLPILRDRELRRNLDIAGADEVEAYRIGAEEAQREIVSRLAEVPACPPVPREADNDELRAALRGLRDPDKEWIASFLDQVEREVSVLPDREDRVLRLCYFVFSHGLLLTSEQTERARAALRGG
jgi:hypothetical protein